MSTLDASKIRQPRARWFRDAYCDAVWESEALDADAKAIAETMARHARNENDEKTSDADLCWVVYTRLMAKSGVGRRARVAAVLRRLVDDGWLVVVRDAPRRPTLYRMTIPRSSTLGTTDDGVGSSVLGTTKGLGASSALETTVVPFLDAGSSIFEILEGVGSSEGGTLPLEELPLLKEPQSNEASADASSSSANAAKPAAPRRDEDDDEARQKRINKRRAAEARKATSEVIRRLGVNRDEASLLIDYLVENAEDEGAPIRNIAAFVDACPNEDLDAHLDEARCRFEPPAPDHPDWVVEVKRVRTELERLESDMNGVELDAIAAAHLAAFRRGCRADEPVPAINGARHSDVRGPAARAAACIAALNALADVWATT